MNWEMVAGLMDEFVSTFTNRLDAKGRVSIPASFRLVLARDGSDGLYCCPTLDRMAVDAGGKLLRDTIRHSLGQFEPFSEEHEQLSTTLLGESEILKIDQDGRTVLSDAIREHAGVTDQVTFVGHGFKFQIWEPERFEVHREEAKQSLRALRSRLSGGGSAPRIRGGDER
jgi:MraZ protein